MPLGSWQLKTNQGAHRLGCLDCGAHTLIGRLTAPRCPCCGSRDLRSVATADAELRRQRDVRDRSVQFGAAPLTFAL
jgi:Zn finger protein HypA/HybF involved in hydrogenase expression